MKAQPWVVTGLVVIVCAGAVDALAQTERSAFEVGGHLSTLRIGEAGNTNAGFGGRVSYDFSRWLAVDGEVGFFPNDRLDVDSGVPSFVMRTRYSRRRLEGFVGPKIGVRSEKFGAFAKVRPGFAHLVDKGLRCIGDACALVLMAIFARPDYRTELALDLGGIFEFYPTSRTTARFDLGTTAIHLKGDSHICRMRQSCRSDSQDCLILQM